jgi:IS30 family transposase
MSGYNQLSKQFQAYKPDLSKRDMQLIKGIERRLNSLISPLQICLVQAQHNSTIKPVVSSTVKLIQDIEAFMAFERP